MSLQDSQVKQFRFGATRWIPSQNRKYGRNERSPAQDMESGDSNRTQPLVVLPERLITKDFTFHYRSSICATGAKLRLCSGVGPSRRNASRWPAEP
jgi:hypothetical protein